MDSPGTSVSRSNSTRARASDRERDDKAGIKLKPTRYKEKFQALRERYDRVTAAHEGYQRDLNVAAAKLKGLQDENDFLLDAINLAEPDITTILSPPQHEGVNSHVTPPESRTDIGSNVGIASRTPHLPSQSPHMNGNSNARHPNGNRHRPIKPEEHGFPVDHVPFAHSGRI
ncbi:hypothetical protein L208DRAFT_364288 [Tricholoma matsutake]|nr:hypothetical protein L208DRAFT_364288 [Tricholoma matsutake 945]